MYVPLYLARVDNILHACMLMRYFIEKLEVIYALYILIMVRYSLKDPK